MKCKYIAASLLLTSSAFLVGCMEDFAEVNTNPTVVSKPDPRYLFTEALSQFDANDYFTWYGDCSSLQKWSQTTTATAGNENLMTTKTAGGITGSQVYKVMNQVNELNYVVKTLLTTDEQVKYVYLQALCNPLMIYLGMLDTDMYGSMAYSEAYQARYGGTLTPKYDTQAELFELWEQQLKAAVETLASDVTVNGVKIPQQSLGNQDFIYKGDYSKWLKFANSLRLKLAARLINEDRARALAIVKEVSKYPIMSDLGDDFIYNKSSKDYHMPGGNDMSNRGAGSLQLVNFMVDHKDPRVRVFFEKNDYNSVVVQAFLDKGQRLPSFISDKVETEEVGGKQVFKGWKAPGEPWVRYYGLPTEVDAGLSAQYPQYADYYDKEGKLWKVSDKDGKGETTYYPYSSLNEYMFDKKVIIDYPVAPGAPKVQIVDLYPWFGMYLSTAEVNLYLAEFKLLSAGQDIGFTETAESYLKKGVEFSLRAYDKLAGLNHVPYYDNTFNQDKHDVSIKLLNSEVTNLLADGILKLDGSNSENLEKVYLQQYIHFIFFPVDQYVMMRRSGCPMKDSGLYEMLDLNPKATSFPLPRRFQVTQPALDDKMGDIKIKAYQDQGYSFGPAPATLNTERVWYDKKAPQFGEGPK